MHDQPTDFTDFFRRAEPLLRRALVAGYGGDLGRDATAEALTYGWDRWERVRLMENPTGYLYRVGDRWARRRRIVGRRRVGFDPGGGEPESFYEPALARALEDLPRRQRQAVTLVHGLGMTHAETADVLGLSRSSVQNHVERAIDRLRTTMGVER